MTQVATLAACGLLLLPAAGRAARPPVVMVVFDEFSSTSLLGAHRRIDAVRYPNFAALGRDATWYRNATTLHDSTSGSIPAILDGRRPVYRRGVARPRSSSIMAMLARRGYRVHASTEANGTCPPRFCGSPEPTRHWLVRNRYARFAAWASAIRPTARPALWLKHTLLPHLPWVYTPSGRQYVRGVSTPIAGLNSERSVFNRYLVRLAFQRHLLQVGAVDRLLGRLVDRLKRTGMYERALVIVTADHGISFRRGERDRRTVTPANLPYIAPVPLLIKRPRQRRGGTSRVWARTVDIVPTIADVLNVRVPWRTAGRSLLGGAARGRTTVSVAGRSPAAPVVQQRVGAFAVRVGRVIRYQHAVFGYGRVGPGLYGIGPARRLRGRAVSGLPAVGVGRVRARLAFPGEIHRVSLSARFRPALVAGQLRGTRRGVARAVAVAVNGRIAATGRTFHLLGGGGEQFAVLVPDWLFLPGRNRVAVYAIASRHGRLRLRLLGGA